MDGAIEYEENSEWGWCERVELAAQRLCERLVDLKSKMGQLGNRIVAWEDLLRTLVPSEHSLANIAVTVYADSHPVLWAFGLTQRSFERFWNCLYRHASWDDPMASKKIFAGMMAQTQEVLKSLRHIHSRLLAWCEMVETARYGIVIAEIEQYMCLMRKRAGSHGNARLWALSLINNLPAIGRSLGQQICLPYLNLSAERTIVFDWSACIVEGGATGLSYEAVACIDSFHAL